MSEQIRGLIGPRAGARPPRAAAAVILVREEPDRQVFWVRRGPKVSFSGGFHAFPGGAVDRDDATTPIHDCPQEDRGFRVCALRELFEEAGVLVARGAERLEPAQVHALRRRLLEGEPFAKLLADAGLELDGAVLRPAGRWVTPPFSPIRFDARFFVCLVPESTQAEVIPGELSEGGWIEPSVALARWEAGAALLHPPNHHALATLAGFPVEAAIPRLRRPPFMGDDGVVERIEFQRGILFFPMLTPTLPPALHTHTYIVGTGELAIVDPGSPWPAEQERLWDLLDQLRDEGRLPRIVLLTHHHADHVGAAVALSERYDVPIAASAVTLSRLGVTGRTLVDGERIELDGPMSMRLECLLTEGHARGHLVFRDVASGALLAGDMIAGGTTIVIDPPEGDLGVYLDSLRRLRALPAGTIYPSHGYVIRDGIAKIDEYLRHREARVRQILERIAIAPCVLAELVRTVYQDTPAELHPLAERSALASLFELERRGDAEREGDLWCARRA